MEQITREEIERRIARLEVELEGAREALSDAETIYNGILADIEKLRLLEASNV